MIRTLKSQAEIVEARKDLQQKGIDFTIEGRLRLWHLLYRIRFRDHAPKTDIKKSWDIANCIEVIQKEFPNTQANMLDMGCYNSEILWALHTLGYHDLHGCDLNPLCKWMPYWHKIKYTCADLTQTPYPENYFSVITSISVIEHGVPIDLLIKEIKRLLINGGLFIFTTDFDGSGKEHNIDPDFLIFGQSWKIFSTKELQELIKKFESEGFELVDSNESWMTVKDTPIEWNNETYTFSFVALRLKK